MKTRVFGGVAALTLAACSMQTETVEESTNPAAGQPPLTFPANNMTEFQAAMNLADDYCYKQRDLMRARYLDRTPDGVRFECVER
jgi:hypothetical protein